VRGPARPVRAQRCAAWPINGKAGTPAAHLHDLAAEQNLTLLTASKDIDHRQAAALAAWLNSPRK
jgi:uncharacterized protein YeaO (DUF488 family)